MTEGFSVGAEHGENTGPHARRAPITITHALIAINVLVFVAMVVRGVSFWEPTPREVVPWGADFGPLTAGAGQWWRMLTSCFVHFGLIHIGMNMYVLYQIGPFIEAVFGRARYLFIYLFAGLTGSLVSLWVHPLTVSAGASGAIFGLYGAVFGFLLMERRSLNPGAAKSIAKSAGIFVVYNVVYGTMNGTVDIAAHAGGLVAGALAGLLLVRRRAGGPWRVPQPVALLALAAALGAGMRAVAARPENRSPSNGLMVTLITSRSVPLAQDGQLVYTGSVTEADAKKLADALNATELGKVKGVLVIFSKKGGKTTVSIPLGRAQGTGGGEQTTPWNDPEVVEEFTALGQQIAPVVGESSYDMVLLNASGQPQRTLPITAK